MGPGARILASSHPRFFAFYFLLLTSCCLPRYALYHRSLRDFSNDHGLSADDAVAADAGVLAGGGADAHVDAFVQGGEATEVHPWRQGAAIGQDGVVAQGTVHIDDHEVAQHALVVDAHPGIDDDAFAQLHRFRQPGIARDEVREIQGQVTDLVHDTLAGEGRGNAYRHSRACRIVLDVFHLAQNRVAGDLHPDFLVVVIQEAQQVILSLKQVEVIGQKGAYVAGADDDEVFHIVGLQEKGITRILTDYTENCMEHGAWGSRQYAVSSRQEFAVTYSPFGGGWGEV